MRLLTKAIIKATPDVMKVENCTTSIVTAKFFHPCSCWTWYLLGIDKDDLDYCFGYVVGFEEEFGYFSISELESIVVRGLKVERDRWFTPAPIQEVIKKHRKERGYHE